MRILGIDPGFASLGYSVVDPDIVMTCLEAGVIRTQKSKSKVPSYVDNMQRAQVIAAELSRIIKKHEPVLIIVEAESWTRTASDKLLGIARGVIYGLAEYNLIPIEQVQPQLMRSTLLDKKSASKSELESWLLKHVLDLEEHLDVLPKGQRGHAADATGVAVTATRRSDLFRLLRRVHKGAVS